MSLYSRRLTQQVTLHLRSAAAEDDHGNPTTTETLVLVPGYLSRHSPQEALEGQVVGEAYRLFLEPDVELTGWDAISVEGVSYEVIGSPWPVFNPRTARVHHVEADVRRAGTS